MATHDVIDPKTGKRAGMRVEVCGREWPWISCHLEPGHEGPCRELTAEEIADRIRAVLTRYPW
jgi:hypothetical protein